VVAVAVMVWFSSVVWPGLFKGGGGDGESGRAPAVGGHWGSAWRFYYFSIKITPFMNTKIVILKQ